MEIQNPRFYKFGEFILDSRRRILTKNDGEISISSKNFDLLFFLIQNEGRVLSHDEILDHVWEGTFVEQSNLKKGISAIRQVLGETPESSLYIKTIPRKGYSFVAPVSVFQLEQAQQEIHVTATEIIVEEEIIEDDSPQLIQNSLPPNLIGKTQKESSSYIISIFIGFIILGLGVIIWWYFANSNKQSIYNEIKVENIKPQRINVDGEVVELALTSDGKFLVYGKQESSSIQSLWLRKIGTLNSIPLVPPSNKSYLTINISPGNDFVYYSVKENSKDVLYQVPFLGGNPRKILENIHSYISFSPDGKKFAFARNKSDVGRSLIVFDTETSTEVETYQVTGDIHQLIEPRWSPDGKKFAFIASEKLAEGRIWGINEISIDGKNLQNIVKPQKGKIYSLEWLGDESGLVMSRDLNDLRQSQIFRVSYPNGEVQRITNDLLDYFALSLSKDGKTILALQEERKTNIWSADANNLTNTEQITKDLNLPGRFTILPDGNFLAELLENSFQILSVINPNGTSPRPLFSQPSVDRFPSISRDGNSIVYVSRRSGSDQIWVTDISGNNPQKLTEEESFIATPIFSPNGESIYFERYNGTRWQIAKIPNNGGSTEIISNETVNYFNFSSDGELIVLGFLDESAKTWKIAVKKVSDNSLVKVFNISNGSFVLFTPDKKSLILTSSDILREGGNLWIQPFDGSPAKLLIELKDEKIFWANYSSDGKKLFYTKGKINSSAVLLNVETPKQ